MKGNINTAEALSPDSDLNAESSSAKMTEERDVFGGQAVLKKYKTKLRVEFIGLFALMAVVWGLLTLPIIFYYIPSSLVRKFALVMLL